jgi:site-specific recombinase XerD/ribosomal protein S27AE
MEEIDIHEYGRRVERAKALLARSNPISRQNQKLISDFLRHCEANGLSKGRIAKYAINLRQIAEWLGKDFDKATKGDIENLMHRVETSDYSPATRVDYRVIIKSFHRWLKGSDEEYPPEVKWIKTTLKQKDKLLPRELPTEEEIKRLVESADNPRDRAFIMVLYESGGRIGEVGSLRIKDIEFKKDYASIILKGKTGSRRIPIIASVPYLSLWIEHHPDKSNPRAPLWTKFSDGKAMTYPALAKVLKVAAERSGLKKRVSPHKLRHARATFLASKFTEAQMNAYFGWRQGSEMPGTYVHLSGRDLDDAVLGIYGLKERKEKKPVEMAPKECPRCGNSNPATGRFCSRCGMALDLEAVVELERKRREADELMSKLLEDPEVRELLRRKLAELE